MHCLPVIVSKRDINPQLITWIYWCVLKQNTTQHGIAHYSGTFLPRHLLISKIILGKVTATKSVLLSNAWPPSYEDMLFENLLLPNTEQERVITFPCLKSQQFIRSETKERREAFKEIRAFVQSYTFVQFRSRFKRLRI